MAKFSSSYVCQQCEYQSPSYLGKCPNCGSWNSFVETVQQNKKLKIKNEKYKSNVKNGGAPISLSSIKSSQIERVTTGIGELDRVLGGGIVPGMAVLVAGEPGIGKSTLLLQAAEKVAGNVLYV